ncbi:hypothetical protein L210DRAFT_3506188 [Boletus edulis BED1]|uniref:Uncharacterized protein n=1 Tax=Boletus edulis BED1 TaxID=1328754 RepID=A0AAD4GBH0_BOLED|nr:hypothetical protein L210DRAFT_3506188 [Boletus edulis BED1]
MSHYDIQKWKRDGNAVLGDGAKTSEEREREKGSIAMDSLGGSSRLLCLDDAGMASRANTKRYKPDPEWLIPGSVRVQGGLKLTAVQFQWFRIGDSEIPVRSPREW